VRGRVVLALSQPYDLTNTIYMLCMVVRWSGVAQGSAGLSLVQHTRRKGSPHLFRGRGVTGGSQHVRLVFIASAWSCVVVGACHVTSHSHSHERDGGGGPFLRLVFARERRWKRPFTLIWRAGRVGWMSKHEPLALVWRAGGCWWCHVLSHSCLHKGSGVVVLEKRR
jgi:hypothetical protein